VAIFLVAAVNVAVISQIPSYLADSGYKQGEITMITTLYLLGLTVLKLPTGWLFDKKGSMFTVVLMGTLYVIGLASMIVAIKSPLGLAGYAALASAGATLVLIAPPILTRVFFGRKDYANIISLVTMANMLGAALAAPIAGGIRDATGSFAGAWTVCIVSIVIMVALVALGLLRVKKFENADEMAPVAA